MHFIGFIYLFRGCKNKGEDTIHHKENGIKFSPKNDVEEESESASESIKDKLKKM